MSISHAFKAFFGDPQWLKKTGLGVLVMLIPYVGPVAFMGFGLRYLRAIAWGHDEQLPEWKDFGEHLKTGFFGYLVGMVYSLPLILVFGVAVFFVILARVGYFAYAGSANSTIWFFVAVLLAFSAISVLMSAILWPAYAQVALFNTIQSGFEFKALWARTRANASSFWKAFGSSLVLVLVSFGASIVVFGVLLLGFFGLDPSGMSADSASVVMVLLFPAEILATVLLSFVSIPIGLMNNHIWGEYARAAYGLDESPAPTA